MNFETNAKWAKGEFKNAIVWDKRCITSLISMAIALTENRLLSFSSACGKTLRQCGSRIFSHKSMNTDKIQAGHYKETAKRASKEPVVLCVQDTTSLNYSSHKSAEGLGPIDSNPSSKGIFIHTVMALRADGLPLGCIGQKMWTRKIEERGKKHKRKQLPIEEKESHKWIDGLEYVNKRLSEKIKEIWVISDRESDVYKYMTTKHKQNIHLLIRATQPRKIEAEIGSERYSGKLTEIAKKLPKAGSKEIEITNGNRTELINLSISYSKIKLYPPASEGKAAEPVELSLVYAAETGMAENTDKVEWLLLCEQQDMTASEAIKMLDYYTQRWKVERFHYALKTGTFNVERLQFDDAETLMNVLSFYAVLAWHILWLMYYSRLEPNAKAETVIDEVEKEVLEARTGKPIRTIYQAVLAIGKLGGFLGGSKRYPHPGIKVLWIGIVKLKAMKEGWLLAKSHFFKN